MLKYFNIILDQQCQISELNNNQEIKCFIKEFKAAKIEVKSCVLKDHTFTL